MVRTDGGDLDLGTIGSLVFNGKDLDIISTGNIINSGGNLTIDLSNGGGDGGNLNMLAGFNFTPVVGQSVSAPNAVFQTTSRNTLGGSFNLNGAGQTINIDTSGT